MHVFILTVGTRGDVQPFVALGLGLRAAGHEVTLCTSATFESFITDRGLRYAYMNDEIIKLLDTDAGRSAMEEANGLRGYLQVAREMIGKVRPIYRQVLEEAWQAARGADLVLYHPKAIGGYHIAERLGVPGIQAVPLPVTVPTAEFPNIVFPPLPLGGWYNRLSYAFVPLMTEFSYGSVLDDWRRETLDLPRHRRFDRELTRSDGRPVPVLHAYSQHVLPRPADWPDTALVTGYWFLDAPTDWQPPTVLLDFLDAGPPPVYVGFGSISGSNPTQTAGAVLEALDASGQRGILATGWGGLTVKQVPGTVLCVEHVPHDWLFPRVAAVVHHGGAGTTAAGLRAGKPTIVCPFFGDQPFWGNRVRELGVGPAPIPQKQLTADRLTAAIRHATNDAAMQRRAARLGEQIREEQGVATAVAFIEDYAAAWRATPQQQQGASV